MAKNHEPFILEKVTDLEIEGAIEKPMNFPNYASHSQTVEHEVKLVTESTQTVCGENRHKFILSVLASQKSGKMFDTKRNYTYSIIYNKDIILSKLCY